MRLQFIVAALLLSAATAVRAEGVLVPAPNRVDHIYDAVRDVLYISDGGSVLRYELASGAFLTPLDIGTTLRGMDLSPDGNTLVVADQSLVGIRLVNLDTLEVDNVSFTPSFSEGGAWSAAYGADGSVLVAGTYFGSGSVPLRRYVPATGVATQIASINQATMLTASADRSVIGFAESNSSDGPFGRFRVSDGDLIFKDGYTNGTSWFNYEIGVSRDGQQYAIPTYGGTFLADAAMVKQGQIIGVYAGAQPVGVAYHPTQDRVYFPFATTSQVRVYNTATLSQVDSFEFEHTFDHPGNAAYRAGRAKVSADGKLLFVSVDGGIRYVTLFARAPVGFSASAGNGSVTLNWSAAAGATGYSVYQSTAAGGAPGTPVLTGVSGTSVTINGLDNGTTYYFRVASETASGTSTPSNQVGATPVPPPAMLTGLQATARDGKVDLAWPSLAGATSYIVYQGTSPGAATQLASGISGTAYSATGLSNGTTYYFQVAGTNNSGTGARSDEVSATPLPPPPAPTSLVAAPGDGAVTLTWGAADSATSYNVYLGYEPGGQFSYPYLTGIAGTSVTMSGLSNGEAYYFTVAGVNTAGVGEQSGEATATPTPATVVSLWLSQSTVAAGQPVTLNWLASNATSCTATDAWSGTPPFSGSQTLVLAAGSYTFTLDCDGANGSDSASATVVVTAAAPVVTISLDSTSITTDQGATLTWSTSNATSCTASDAWSGDRATAGSLYVSPAVAGSYTYTLTCSNADGDTVQAVTLSVSDPSGPSLTMTMAPGTITLGLASTLTWSTTGATACTASGDWDGARPVASSVAMQPTETGGYTYSLTCTGPGGTTVRSVALLVNPVPVQAGGGGSGSVNPVLLLGLLLANAARRRRARNSQDVVS